MTVLLGAGTGYAQSGSGSGAGAGGAGSSNYGTGSTRPAGGTTSTTGTSASEDARRNAQAGSTSDTTTTATGSGTYGTTATTPADTTGGAKSMTGRATTSSGKLGWTDRRFVTKAADGGKAEVQLAQLAAEKASNSEVKNFAQKLVEDHSQVNSELMALAGQKNVKIDEDDDKDRSYKRLSKKTGTDFDQEFVEHMIDEHEKDIKMFEKASTDAKDVEVRAFAAKHIDHLRQHLQQAQSLRSSIMPTGRMDSTSGRSSSTDTSTSSSTEATSGTTRSTDTSGTSGLTGTPGTTGGTSTESGSGTGSTKSTDTPRR